MIATLTTDCEILTSHFWKMKTYSTSLKDFKSICTCAFKCISVQISSLILSRPIMMPRLTVHLLSLFIWCNALILGIGHKKYFLVFLIRICNWPSLFWFPDNLLFPPRTNRYHRCIEQEIITADKNKLNNVFYIKIARLIEVLSPEDCSSGCWSHLAKTSCYDNDKIVQETNDIRLYY